MTTDDRRRAIGKVVSVAGDRIVVELHGGTANFTVVGFDDVHYVARLGSFVVMPAQAEYVVAEVVGLREKDAPSSRGVQGETTELDKAGSAKFLDLVPVGMLPQRRDGAFKFGVSTFPSLYADALYVLDEELDRIFEVQSATEIIPAPMGNGEATRYNSLSIGTSVVFQDYAVKVRVDEFFGGHSAILGNTGSGKSCTVATLLQSLFEKRDEFFARGATFLLLDVNGEYRSAFSELPHSVKRLYLKLATDPFSPAASSADEAEATAVFRMPHWFMSVEEWELLLRASERTQRPVLRSALGLATLFSAEENNQDALEKLKNHILAKCLLYVLNSADSPAAKADRVRALLLTFQTKALSLKDLGPLTELSYGEMPQMPQLMERLAAQLDVDAKIPNYANRSFRFDDLEHAFDMALLYEESHGNMQIRDYCSQMITRFKWIRERDEFAFLRVPPEKLHEHERDVAQFVERCVGLSRLDGNFQKSSQVIVLDMNEASDEVVEVASAVIARLIFDRLRRAEPRNRTPINLVLEEAHRYIAERPSGYAIDASRIFQRIAKEGRKYGLFLMVASQRPSELSKTVLSQCSNFVVHRIQNPDDLQHIRQMTPFVSDSVMKRLPSLPKQHALIFGNAVNLPTTFRVRDVKPRPKSDDAAIRELWFRPEGKEIELRMPE